MAIQNFLSGGYYGKLGATVGQRWKNKRTIRTYVKPANPRTEVQQANRNKFANAVTFAQMGMQMNYYATVFDDPNFTHWNYRMKVARELRNQGLSNLDLIPLYPTSFVPPILIQSVEVSGIQGQKHITFAVENLNGNSDRVLSLMFALYDENDVFLGYKLYLGYYYASKPGLLEVDVDDVSEINSHCFVRMVTNDDINSLTDMIASPNLQIKQSGPETRAFDTTIREVQKSPAGIKVIFEEPWKDAPTVNTITITANFVSNGANANATATSAALVNENGYCSILIPFVTSDNQHLPALPSGSNFVIATVDYEGATWVYTKTDDNIAYSDTDLTRTINSSPTWNPASTSDIAFTIPFGGTISTELKQLQMVCSGRLGIRNAISQNFRCSGDGSNITFTCTGGYRKYPMCESGDKISLTEMQFICNGVTYNLASQDVNLRNNIDISYYLENLDWQYWRDGAMQKYNELISMTMFTVINGLSRADFTETLDDLFAVKIVSENIDVYPGYSEALGYSAGNGFQIDLTSNFEGQAYTASISPTDTVMKTIPGITIDGIMYTFSEGWFNMNVPDTVQGFPI